MIYRDSAGSGREHSIPANTAARGEYTGEMSLANPIINAAITAAKAPDRTPQRTEDTAPRRSVITASARKISSAGIPQDTASPRYMLCGLSVSRFALPWVFSAPTMSFCG